MCWIQCLAAGLGGGSMGVRRKEKKRKEKKRKEKKAEVVFNKLVAAEVCLRGRGAVISRLSITGADGGLIKARVQCPALLLSPRIDDNGMLPWLWRVMSGANCRGDIIGPGPLGLSKGRDGLGGFCANNSWVYMVGSVQIDTICFPISRLAIEYKAHNQRQRARSTSVGHLRELFTWLRLNLSGGVYLFIFFIFMWCPYLTVLSIRRIYVRVINLRFDGAALWGPAERPNAGKANFRVRSLLIPLNPGITKEQEGWWWVYYQSDPRWKIIARSGQKGCVTQLRRFGFTHLYKRPVWSFPPYKIKCAGLKRSPVTYFRGKDAHRLHTTGLQWLWAFVVKYKQGGEKKNCMSLLIC